MQKLVLILIIQLSCVVNSFASDFGTTGIIDIPTSRMSKDATLKTTFAFQSRSNSYSLTYQALPWLESTFRYTGFNDFFYYDRNLEVKARLFEETDLYPEISIGVRDLVGTGAFGAEYFVANKKVDNFDITLGLGWGRLAGSGLLNNPLTLFSERFEVRSSDIGRGGEIAGGQIFRGKQIGIFGGLRYKVLNLPLNLLLEYNPDTFLWDEQRGGSTPSSKINFGLEYQPYDGISIGITRQHGDEWGVWLQSSIDTSSQQNSYVPPKFISSADYEVSSLHKNLNAERWYDLLLYDIERSGAYLVEAQSETNSNNITLVLANRDFTSWPQLIDHVHRLVNIHLPDKYFTVNYIIEEKGHRVYTISMPRPYGNNVESVFQFDGKMYPAQAGKNVIHKTSFVLDEFIWDVEVKNRFMLFDPDNPLGYQFYLNLGGNFVLPNRWKLHTAYAFDLTNNFSKFKRSSNSVLPHVRSDAVEYFREGKNGLSHLFIERRGSLSKELHYRNYGGILEDMYSGIGGEILYQPFQSRIAFSVSSSYLIQRAFSRDLSHQSFKTWTGHLSAYWATPFNNYDVALHLGRYLAGDKGGTIEVRRTFDNGWMIGAWATLTDVPFEQFGEGSFDKGFFFQIPLGILGSKISSKFVSRIRPIQRDGGARLEGFQGELWWDLREVRYDVFKNKMLK